MSETKGEEEKVETVEEKEEVEKKLIEKKEEPKKEEEGEFEKLEVEGEIDKKKKLITATPIEIVVIVVASIVFLVFVVLCGSGAFGLSQLINGLMPEKKYYEIGCYNMSEVSSKGKYELKSFKGMKNPDVKKCFSEFKPLYHEKSKEQYLAFAMTNKTKCYYIAKDKEDTDNKFKVDILPYNVSTSLCDTYCAGEPTKRCGSQDQKYYTLYEVK